MATRNDKTPSSKGRKALAPVTPVGVDLDPDKLTERGQELMVMGEHHQQVVEQFGDGLPWNPDHYEAAIRSELRRGCEAFLKAGRYLIVARECAAHGEWQGMLDRLGMGRDQASRMMEAARRVSALPNVATSQHLISTAKTESKLIELLSLPEDQFSELAIQGETQGLTIDDVESMTVRELRAAVREARADLDAKDQRITKLSEDLNKAEEKTTKAQRKWKSSTPDEQQVTLEQRVTAARLEIIATIGTDKVGLVAALVELAEHCNAHDLECATFVGDTLDELIAAVRRVRDDYDYGFNVDLAIDARA
jgi:hypothetical protein